MKKVILPKRLKNYLVDAFCIIAVLALFILWLNAVNNIRSHAMVNHEPEAEVKNEKNLSDAKSTAILTREDYSKLYTCKDDIRNDTCLQLTYEECQILMKVARHEGGDTVEGQLWVMCTIINRVNDPNYPDNIIDVLSVPEQFETYRDGSYKNVELNANSHHALAQLESGYNPTEGSLYFESSTNSNHSWHALNLDYIKEVEGQRYYR